MAGVAVVVLDVSGVGSRGRHRAGSCCSSNRWGCDLNVSPLSPVCRLSSRASEGPHAKPTQHGQRIARHPGHYPLSQADPRDQTEEVFDIPKVPVMGDPSLLVHTQPSKNAEPEVHRAWEIDSDYRQFRLWV